LKVTEQGEVVAARYGNAAIALRHLELLAGAVIAADATSSPAPEDAVELMERLAAASSVAYRSLVYDDPGFAGFFRRVTPIDVLAAMQLGSRPASRHRRPEVLGAAEPEPPPPLEPESLDRLRAIPWGFAWAQARIELPGWFGLGAAIEAVNRDQGEPGVARLTELYRTWPFLSAILDHAELAIARSDLGVARRYAALATGPGDERRWATIEAEHERSRRWLLAITGRSRLLESSPVVARAIELRNPDIDTLSELQVGRLARLRALPPGHPDREVLERLVRLTVSGVAAGLQVTG
jgi:phosphoenolpyruvate carboxylase